MKKLVLLIILFQSFFYGFSQVELKISNIKVSNLKYDPNANKRVEGDDDGPIITFTCTFFNVGKSTIKLLPKKSERELTFRYKKIYSQDFIQNWTFQEKDSLLIKPNTTEKVEFYAYLLLGTSLWIKLEDTGVHDFTAIVNELLPTLRMHYMDPNNEFFSSTDNSCNNAETKEIIYHIINDLFENSSLKIDIIISEINTILSYRELIKENERYPAPPSYGAIYYDKEFFENLYKEALISKNDVDYMYGQIKNLSIINLDSNKIQPKTISIREYVSSMRDSIGNVIKNFKFPYQGKSVCRFSNPIFSLNKKIALISVWTAKNQGGFDWDNYKTLLLKMENEKWKIYKIMND